MENVESNSIASPKGVQPKRMSHTKSVGEVKIWPVVKSGSAENKTLVPCARGTSDGAVP